MSYTGNTDTDSVPNSRAYELAAQRKDFISSTRNLRGENLPASDSRKERYIVHSYGAVIALWVEGRGWLMVTRKYSVTTSKHVAGIKRAVFARSEAIVWVPELTD